MAALTHTRKPIIARKTPERLLHGQVHQGVFPWSRMVGLLEEKNVSAHIILPRIPTTEVRLRANERVRVSGWLHSWRELGSVSFLVLRDAWGLLQTVAETPAELQPL